MSKSLRALAEQIPAEYRREILELNLIDNAVAIAGNESMHFLGAAWKTYIDPEWEPDCNLCYGKVLKNFKAMKETMITMEQEAELLKNVK